MTQQLNNMQQHARKQVAKQQARIAACPLATAIWQHTLPANTMYVGVATLQLVQAMGNSRRYAGRHYVIGNGFTCFGFATAQHAVQYAQQLFGSTHTIVQH